MILAGVLLKLGGYGLLRVAMPLFPVQLEQASTWLAAIAVVSILIGALCAMGQTDFKRLVAYSSVSHMGFVLLGVALATTAGVGGALFMMVAHGLTSAALFFVVGIIYERVGHRDLARLGGFARTTPNFARVSALFIFASLGLPGLCNFVGEIMVLIGTFAAAPVARSPAAVYGLAILATFGIVLTAAYMLWALQRAFLGIPLREVAAARDLDTTESLVLWTLAALVIALGIMPWALMLMFSDTSVAALVRAVVG
jgi:NADH-quinone oxidoreductase subunit M